MQYRPKLTGRKGLIIGIVLTALVAVSCAQNGTSIPARGVASPDAGVSQSAPRSVQSIKTNLPTDFDIRAYRGADVLGGERVELSSVLAQGKPVALNFFAGLCPPCRAEMPHLQEVYDQLGDRFVLIGVDIGPFTGLGTNDDGLSLIEDLDLSFPTGSTSQRDVVNRYHILGMPSTVFLTPDGKVLRKWDGALTREKLEELVEQLIAASPS
jgi:thiol-disulfide isomerase/thioredoxin